MIQRTFRGTLFFCLLFTPNWVKNPSPSGKECRTQCRKEYWGEKKELQERFFQRLNRGWNWKGKMDRLGIVWIALFFFKYLKEIDADSSLFKVYSYSLSDTRMLPRCGTEQNRATLMATQLPCGCQPQWCVWGIHFKRRNCIISSGSNLYKITYSAESHSVWIWCLNDIFGVKISIK